MGNPVPPINSVHPNYKHERQGQTMCKSIDPRTWKYENFVPQEEDFDAQVKAYTDFDAAEQRKPIQPRLNEAEWIQLVFAAGFFRGCKWMQDKMNSK